MYHLLCTAILGAVIYFTPFTLSPAKINDTSYYRGNITVSSQHGNENAIIGRWITLQKNLAVEVYKKNNNYRAKIIWFKVEDTTRPMNTRLDEKNPDPALRNRKWLGMEVLHNLKYNSENEEWENGIIYDAKHGREWDSIAWINKGGLLKVKGYWVFKFISETLTFEKM